MRLFTKHWITVCAALCVATAGFAQNADEPLQFPRGFSDSDPDILFGLDPYYTLQSTIGDAFGVAATAEYAPTDAYSFFARFGFITGEVSETTFQFLFPLDTTTMYQIYDLVGMIRMYPTKQAPATLSAGIGFGAIWFATSASGTLFDEEFLGDTDLIVQPQIMFNTAYKLFLIDSLFVEAGATYKIVLPPPGFNFELSSSLPMYSFLFNALGVDGSDDDLNGPLNGLEFTLVVGYGF